MKPLIYIAYIILVIYLLTINWKASVLYGIFVLVLTGAFYIGVGKR